MEDANWTSIKLRLDELKDLLEERQTGVTKNGEGMVRRLIERITVYDDNLAFEFKCVGGKMILPPHLSERNLG